MAAHLIRRILAMFMRRRKLGACWGWITLDRSGQWRLIKTLPEGSPDNAQRLEMARLARRSALCRGVRPGAAQEGKSYSVDTVRAVHAQYPDAELWLLMGSDMLNILHLWRAGDADASGEYRDVCSGQCWGSRRYLRVCSRCWNTISMRRYAGFPWKRKKPRPVRSVPAGAGWRGRAAEPAGWGYIQREHLYGTKADLRHLPLDALRSVALSYLRCTRMAHVLGTEQEAVRLARRCGIDETEARTAVLLHDCTKKCSREEQLALCERYGLTADKVECSQDQLFMPKPALLWHGMYLASAMRCTGRFAGIPPGKRI